VKLLRDRQINKQTNNRRLKQKLVDGANYTWQSSLAADATRTISQYSCEFHGWFHWNKCCRLL